MNTLTPADYEAYWRKAIPFKDYSASIEAEAATNPTSGNSKYVPINWKRMQRIGKTMLLSTAAIDALNAIKSPLRWLVITENWCGDSAQSTPIMHLLEQASNGKLELRFIYRDENPELINAHLTGTSMSIPKVIQLNDTFEVTGSWGPRPDKAHQLVLRLKSNPATEHTYSEELHRWYAQDKQMSIEADLVDLLKTAAQ